MDKKTRKWRIDIMIDKGLPDEWIYKRSDLIRSQRNAVIYKSIDGIRYLSPAAVLLFKAKHMREKDNHDFEIIAPVLSKIEISWLQNALNITHPNHDWISKLPS